MSMDLTKGKILSNLFRFMNLFEINRFKVYSINNKEIKAQVGWANDSNDYDYEEDEEVQDILWEVDSSKEFENAILIGEIALENKFLLSDKIIVNTDVLFESVNKITKWNKYKFNNNLKKLLQVKVHMIDNSQKTDYFFIHF